MSKRNNRSHRLQSTSFSNSNWLKFSNTSVTWARARQQRSESSTNSSSLGIDSSTRRRKFLNASTEFLHIISLIIMSLCRQITNRSLLHKRLIVYLFLIFIGGLLNDFASFLLRALIISLSPGHFLNQYFVKLAWLWNTLLLFPFITLSSSALRTLDSIALNKVEQSIEDYHEKKMGSSSLSNSTNSKTSNNAWNNSQSFGLNNKTQIMLQTQSQTLIKQYQQTLLNQADQCLRYRRFSLQWFRYLLCKIIQVTTVKDVLRFLICTSIYYGSIMIFAVIQSMTTISARIANRPMVTTNELSIPSNTQVSELTGIIGRFDISGHVFILIFSNLIFIEECTIMTGWEPLGDRLHSLSLEYMNIEINLDPISERKSSSSEPASYYIQTNRILFLAWSRYQTHTHKLRLIFLLVTIFTILWDFMLLQTIFFYHSLIEKLLALGWAYSSWYFCYRFLFPLLRLQVRKVSNQ